MRRTPWIAVACFFWLVSSASAQPPYVRTLIVNSGLSPTLNASTLLSQLASITTASATNPWLLKVEPGLYDLGSGSLTMKDYVDIEGSGVGITIITSAQNRGPGNLATINIPTSVHAELRELTVKNTSSEAIGITNNSSNASLLQLAISVPSGSVNTMGILSQGSNPTLSRINIQVNSTNNTAQGIYIAGGNPIINDVTVASTNTGSVVLATGILVAGGSATIDGAVVTVAGAASNQGLYLQGGTTSLISNSRFTGTSAYGVYATASAIAILNSVTATGNTGAPGGGTVAGVYNGGATLELNHSAAIGNGAGFTSAYGLDSNGSAAAVTQVNHSDLIGTNSGIALFNGTVRAGVSRVSGAGSSLGTTLVCVGDYNLLFAPLNSLCL